MSGRARTETTDGVPRTSRDGSQPSRSKLDDSSASHETSIETLDPATRELIDAALAAGSLRSLTLGTERQPLALPAASASAGPDVSDALENARGPARWPHAAAALAGAAAAFTRPTAPEWAPLPGALEDPRPRLAAPERVALLRLVERNERGFTGEVLVHSLCFALERAQVALHPFDLHRLGRLLCCPEFRPGAIESAWLKFQEGAPDAPGNATSDGDELDEGATHVDVALRSDQPAQLRVDALRAARALDVDAGREAVRAALEGAHAAVRARLITALDVGLGPLDLPLLEPLREDRSKLVREAIEPLLRRIPGTPEAETWLASAIGHIETKAPGNVARVAAVLGAGQPTMRLRLVVPEKSRRSGAGVRWALQAFQGIGLDTLCQHFKLEPFALARAAELDPVLQTVLLLVALESQRARRLDVDLDQFVGALPEADWELLVEVEGARARALVDTLQPESWTEWPSVEALAHLHRMCRGPLPAAQSKALVHSAVLQRMLEGSSGDETEGGEAVPDLEGGRDSLHTYLLLVAALAVSEDRRALRDRIGVLDARTRATAADLLTVLDSIERAGRAQS